MMIKKINSSSKIYASSSLTQARTRNRKNKHTQMKQEKKRRWTKTAHWIFMCLPACLPRFFFMQFTFGFENYFFLMIRKATFETRCGIITVVQFNNAEVTKYTFLQTYHQISNLNNLNWKKKSDSFFLLISRLIIFFTSNLSWHLVSRHKTDKSNRINFILIISKLRFLCTSHKLL